ncbi:MAG: peptidylprolyl isomerase [Candidatus Tectomicrobia bacterium]|uniref:Peptidylprolyl isomerase n=1 Tax=Tectimicrobiota bacterium TaxID=2528274 RepID=A0A932CMH4_UNCTE|nr:peptidylprolyl isomerase [Candidatus Tectomicrobia bacterium]
MRKSWLWIGLVSVSVLLSGKVAQAEIADRIVARVGHEIITLGEVREMGAELFQRIEAELQGEEQLLKKREVERELVKRIVEEKLIVYKAKKLKITVADEEISKSLEELKKENSLTDAQLEQVLKQQGLTLEEYRKRVKEQMLGSRAVHLEVRSKVQITDQEIEEDYQRHGAEYQLPEDVRIQQIVFLCGADADSKEEEKARIQAQHVLDKLKAGEDFTELAKKYSQDPSSAEEGSNYFKRGDLLPTLEEAAFKLKSGEITPIMRTQYGFHILKVIEKREGRLPPLAQFSDKIKEKLFRERATKVHDAWIQGLYKEFFVEILY